MIKVTSIFRHLKRPKQHKTIENLDVLNPKHRYYSIKQECDCGCKPEEGREFKADENGMIELDCKKSHYGCGYKYKINAENELSKFKKQTLLKT